MQILKPLLERAPMVWLLLGLLFNAAGLYLGFDYGLTFVYLIIGWFCGAYGVAVYLFNLKERRRKPENTRLSPHFITVGAANPVTGEAPGHASVPEASSRSTD